MLVKQCRGCPSGRCRAGGSRIPPVASEQTPGSRGVAGPHHTAIDPIHLLKLLRRTLAGNLWQ